MKKKDIYVYLSLALIFWLGLFLRFYRLNLNIPEPYADETGHYVLRNLILGRDTNLWFFLYNKLFLGTFSFTWIFGLTPFGVRSASALYGSFTSLAAFCFAYTISKRKSVSFLMALLVAIIPWNFMISRLGHTHVVVIVLLTMIHVSLFLIAQKFRDYLVSLVPLLLALLYYPSMVVVVPFALVLVLWYAGQSLSKKQKVLTLIIATTALVVLAPIVLNYFHILDVKGRALDLAIWRDVNTPYEIDRYRALSWNSAPSIFSFNLPPEKLANKLVYNKAMANLSVFTRNYLSFFSPDWLFLKGDAILRHSTGQVGAFYLFLFPFMLYGAFKFFQTKDTKTKVTFLVWILVSPVPAAITKDGAGYLLRVVTLLPFLTYFSSLGLYESFGLVKKTWRLPYGILIALLALYSAYYFFYGYFHVYPSLAERSFENGFKELSDFQISRQNTSLLIIWDGYYHDIDFRFWQNTPYQDTKLFTLKRIEVGDSVFWQTFTNLYFSAPKSASAVKQFIAQYHPQFVVLPDRYFVKYPEDVQLLLSTKPVDQISYPDKTTALTIYTPLSK